MKKATLILIIIALVLVIAVVCAAVYFFNSPQYALMQIMKDVKAQGLEGLEPHLTGNATDMLEKVTSASQNPLLSAVFSLLIPDKYLEVVKSELQNITWNVEDILTSRKRAVVILSFDYEGDITGTINLSMLRTDSGWKIDDVSAPRIDGFRFEDVQLPDLKSFLFQGDGETADADSSASDGFQLPKFEDIDLSKFQDISLPDLKGLFKKGGNAAE